MSRTILQSAVLTGHAVVHLKTGETIVGLAVHDTRAITVDGSLRVISTVGGESGVVSYRPRRKRTIPLLAIRDIWWDDDASVTYSHAAGI